MALQIFDRIKERIQTGSGTGPLTLLGAPTGFKTFSSRLSISDTTYYCIEGPGGAFEIGVGTLTTSTTLARTTVLKSSNSDSTISIGDSGQYFVFITLAADKAVYKDGSGRIVSGAAGIIFSDASIQTTAATTPDLSAYAPLASPTFTGTPAAPTATSGTNTTQLATTAFVASAVGSIDLTPYALLPDTLPAVGTLLSYGGNRQLAAGGTVTHGGALTLGGLQAAYIGINRTPASTVPLAIQTNATSSDGLYLYNNSGINVSDFGVTGGGHLRWRFKDAASTNVVTINTDGVSNGLIEAICPAAASKGIVVKGAVSQSGNAFEYQSSAGTALFEVMSSGGIRATSNMVIDPSGLATLRSVQVGFITTTAGAARGVLNGASTTTYFGSAVAQNVIIGANSRADLTIDGTTGAITTTGNITLTASQQLFVSNGTTTGNYLLSGATAVFANNSVAQGGWNTNGMYVRRLFIDYANADICLARVSTSNLGIYAGDGTTPAAITCGAITASGTITLSGDYLSYPRISTAGNLVIYARDANRMRFDTLGATLASTGSIGFNSGTNLDTGAQDAYFVRNSASSIGVKGAGGIDGNLTCGAITASGMLTLPSYGTIVFATGGGVVRTDGNDRIGLDYGGNGLQVGSGRRIGFCPAATIDGSVSDAYFVRNSASSIGVKGASGIDAALTCGAITASGIVGIGGTPYSSSSLHIQSSFARAILLNNSTIGTGATDGAYFGCTTTGQFTIYNQESTSPAYTYIGQAGALPMYFATNGVTRMTIAGDGAITASGTVNYADGTIDARTSMNHALTLRATGAANAIRVLDGTGVTKWAVDSTGSMTIGTLGYITFPHSTNLGDPNQIITGGGTGFGIKTSGSLFVATGGTVSTFTVGTTGNVTASGNITVAGGSSSSYSVGTTSGTMVFGINATKYVFGIGQISAGVQYLSGIAQSLIGFSSSTDPTANPDTAIARNAAGVLEINNGTAGTFRDLSCRAITASGTIRQAAEITYTPTGTTQTITLNDGNHQTLNLTSATGAVTVTLTVPTSSSAGTIIVNQHASAAKDLTWAVSSGTIRWMGAEPDWAADAISSDRLVSWRWNGSIMRLVATDVGT